MNSSKQVICSERMRQVPAQFSWVDQRLVRDRHLDHLDVYAAALYLFLVTVADAQGLSWYGDASTARRLSIDEARLRRARDDLIRAGLLVYARGLYQLLALGAPLPPTLAPIPAPRQVADNLCASSVRGAPVAARAVVNEHLAALHAALGRQT
jgi:hypothetical protein